MKLFPDYTKQVCFWIKKMVIIINHCSFTLNIFSLISSITIQGWERRGCSDEENQKQEYKQIKQLIRNMASMWG